MSLLHSTIVLATANVTSALGLLLFWLPLAFCAFGYFVRTWRDVRKDVKAREADDRERNTQPPRGSSYYAPSITIGTVIGRGLVSCIPVANLFAAVFSVAPQLFGDFFKWIGRVFDQPLVPGRRK